MKHPRLGPAVLLLALLLVLCLGPAAAQDRAGGGTLVVGSKNFSESRLLGEIMAQLIEAETDLRVERKVNIGGTSLVFAALQEGDIDLFAEYTGTGWSVVLERELDDAEPLRTYLEVDREYRRRFGAEWLLPFGFDNSYAVALRQDRAEELGIERISELSAHAGELVAAWSHEFLDRLDGAPGLAAHYGLEFGEVRGLEHGVAYEAIRSGRADLTDAYSTDGKLLRLPLRVLEDDRGFFPPYQCAPVIRSQALEEHPELEEVLGALAFRISDQRMQELNYAVDQEGRAFADVAKEFLVQEGLIGGRAEKGESRHEGSFLGFLLGRMPEILGHTWRHLQLAGSAVLLAIALAVPTGILLTRKRALARPVLAAAGILQTVPSLALLVFMIPLLGLGAPAAVAALFLYALLPIVRNTYTGIREVTPDVIEVAVGMGLTGGQILRRIELPLAIRTIMAGVRTAAVIAVGGATLAAFVGAGGLGDPIVTGLQLADTRLILSGAIPAAILAVGVDALLGWVEGRLSPWKRLSTTGAS